MKALILIAAGLLSSGAIAQSTMGNSMGNSMGGSTTGSMTHDTKTTTMHHTGTGTHSTMRAHHKSMRHGCTTRMHNGHKMRTCTSHMKHPMHTMMHKKVVVETKTKM